jgi:hypothetical protein
MARKVFPGGSLKYALHWLAFVILFLAVLKYDRWRNGPM